MAIIEGLGDEVVWAALALLLIVVIFLAWISTYVHAHNAINVGSGSVWLVQLHNWSNRPVQAFQIETSTDVIESATGSISVDASPVDLTPRGIAEQPAVTVEPAETDSTESNSALKAEKKIEEEHPSTASTAQEIHESHRIDTSLEGSSGSHESNSQPDVGIRTRIRLKFLDETQKLVASLLSQTVGQFKREHFDEAVQEGQVIRLIYNGQLLRDDNRSLESYGLSDNCVVHCHLSNTPLSGQASSDQQRRGSRVHPGVNRSQNRNGDENDPDNRQSFIGRHIFLVVGLNFVLLWLGWLRYSPHFDFTAFFSLVVCTVVYFSFLYASRLRNRLGPNGVPAAQTGYH